jgi:hypothetical protein
LNINFLFKWGILLLNLQMILRVGKTTLYFKLFSMNQRTLNSKATQPLKLYFENSNSQMEIHIRDLENDSTQLPPKLSPCWGECDALSLPPPCHVLDLHSTPFLAKSSTCLQPQKSIFISFLKN